MKQQSVSDLASFAIDRFDRLLRFSGAGFVALAIAWFADPGRVEPFIATTEPWLTMLFVAPVLGALVYGLHIGLLYDWVYLPLLGSVCKERRWRAQDEPAAVAQFLNEFRWNSGNSLRVPVGELAKMANIVHFLYCSAWVAFVVPIVMIFNGRLLPDTERVQRLILTLVLGVTLFVAARRHHRLYLFHLVQFVYDTPKGNDERTPS